MRTKIIHIVFGLLLLSCRSFSNRPDSATVIQSSSHFLPESFLMPADSQSATIHFSMAGNLIVLQANVDSIAGNFILDTGAPGLILNMSYFRHYTSLSNTDEYRGGITGSVAFSSPVMIDKLHLGPFEFNSVTAERVHLGHLETSKGIKIHGLLGLELFQRFEMIIDYANEVIYLHRLGRKDWRDHKNTLLSDYSKYWEIPIYQKDRKLLLDALIAGKKTTFLLDTGAESNILDSRLGNSIFEQVIITQKVNLLGAGMSKIEALFGELNKIEIQKKSFANIPVLVTNLEKMCIAYDRCIDGMLGFDFFGNNKVGFDFMKNKMYLWK